MHRVTVRGESLVSIQHQNHANRTRYSYRGERRLCPIQQPSLGLVTRVSDIVHRALRQMDILFGIVHHHLGQFGSQFRYLRV